MKSFTENLRPRSSAILLPSDTLSLISFPEREILLHIFEIVERCNRYSEVIETSWLIQSRNQINIDDPLSKFDASYIFLNFSYFYFSTGDKQPKGILLLLLYTIVHLNEYFHVICITCMYTYVYYERTNMFVCERLPSYVYNA